MSRSQLNSSPRIALSKCFNASPQAVFAAWIEPASLKQWLCPEGGHVAFIAANVRVGGSYRIDMQFGDRTVTHTGIYREITPPARLVFTWISENTQQQETLVTVEIRVRDKQTELVLTHERFPSAESAQNHSQGWQSVLLRLGQFLAP